MSAATYAVGKRVYRHGSHAPTMGTVDPQGYVERERASQTRSGLAAAALNRGGAPQQTAQPGEFTVLDASPHVDQGFANADAKFSVSPTGKVTMPTTSLPYDAQYATDSAALLAARNAYKLQQQQAQQGIEQNYVQGQRTVNQQIPDVMRSLLNNFSGRGMAFSSGYGQTVGKQQGQFSQALADLAAQHTQGLNNISAANASYESDYANQLAAARAAAVRRLATQAGKLGLT